MFPKSSIVVVTEPGTYDREPGVVIDRQQPYLGWAGRYLVYLPDYEGRQVWFDAADVVLA